MRQREGTDGACACRQIPDRSASGSGSRSRGKVS